MKRLIELLLLVGLAVFVLLCTVRVSRHHHHGPRDIHIGVRSYRDLDGRRLSQKAKPPIDAAPAIRPIPGRVSATEERARDDALRALAGEVSAWLDPQVPTSWRVPASLLRPLVRETRVTPTEKDYGTVYTAVLDADFSAAQRDRIVEAYRREVGRDRTIKLGAGFGFLLACLAAVSGYIRADEATRGYYTNRLRLVAAAAVGAAGVVLYRYLV
jgi:hypothetical protein